MAFLLVLVPNCCPIDTRRSQLVVTNYTIVAKFYDSDLYLRFARWEYLCKGDCFSFPIHVFDPFYFFFEFLYMTSKWYMSQTVIGFLKHLDSLASQVCFTSMFDYWVFGLVLIDP